MNRTFVYAMVALAAGAACFAAPVARAQDSQAGQPAPCSDPEYRQFDFWLGEWNVLAKDKKVGTNSVVRILGGCVVEEHYVTPQGYEGWSHNVYDGRLGKWHQTWVDNRGGALYLDGGLVDGKMVLEGERPAPDGKGTILNRITWSRLDKGRVRQHWEASKDGGKTWTTAFDGTYVRANE